MDSEGSGEGIELQAFPRKNLLQHATRAHFSCGPRPQGAPVDKEDPIAEVQCGLQVVGGKQDGLLLCMSQVAQQAHGAYAVQQIKKGHGLIEQDNGSILCKCPCDHHPLCLSIAELLKGAVCEPHHIGGLHGQLHVFQIRGGEPSEMACPRLPAQCYDGTHIQKARLWPAGEHQCQLSGTLLGTSFRQRDAVQEYLPSDRGAQPRQGVDQGGFTSSIDPDERNEFARSKLYLDTADQCVSVVTNGKGTGGDGRYHAVRAQRLPLNKTHVTTGAPSNDVTAFKGSPSTMGSFTTRSQAKASTAPLRMVMGSKVA